MKGYEKLMVELARLLDGAWCREHFNYQGIRESQKRIIYSAFYDNVDKDSIEKFFQDDKKMVLGTSSGRKHFWGSGGVEMLLLDDKEKYFCAVLGGLGGPNMIISPDDHSPNVWLSFTPKNFPTPSRLARLEKKFWSSITREYRKKGNERKNYARS